MEDQVFKSTDLGKVILWPLVLKISWLRSIFVFKNAKLASLTFRYSVQKGHKAKYSTLHYQDCHLEFIDNVLSERPLRNINYAKPILQVLGNFYPMLLSRRSCFSTFLRIRL